MKFTTLALSLLPMSQALFIPFGLEGALTGSNVPEKFLKDAFLSGSFPSIASRMDPRISYSLYVPPEHYHPRPNTTKPKLPLLVDIHGTGRDTFRIFDEKTHRGFARDTPCAVLAPLFPAGLEDNNDVDSYKVMRSKSLRSDLVLLSILDEVAYRWPGIDTTKIFMMGFSGGGQFGHRFLYLHPDRLAGISIGAPGRVTYLDDKKKWPEGIADAPQLFDKTIEKDSIAQVPIHLVIGDQDTEIHGGLEFWEWLNGIRGGAGGLPPMDESRIDTLNKLRDAWEEDGIQSEMDVVPGVAHDGQSEDISRRVYGFLRPLIQNAYS